MRETPINIGPERENGLIYDGVVRYHGLEAIALSSERTRRPAGMVDGLGNHGAKVLSSPQPKTPTGLETT